MTKEERKKYNAELRAGIRDLGQHLHNVRSLRGTQFTHLLIGGKCYNVQSKLKSYKEELKPQFFSITDFLDAYVAAVEKERKSLSTKLNSPKTGTRIKKDYPEEVFEMQRKHFKKIGDVNTIDISEWKEIPMAEIGFDEDSTYAFDHDLSTGNMSFFGIKPSIRLPNGSKDGYVAMINSYAKLYTDGKKKYYVGGFTIL